MKHVLPMFCSPVVAFPLHRPIPANETRRAMFILAVSRREGSAGCAVFGRGLGAVGRCTTAPTPAPSAAAGGRGGPVAGRAGGVERDC
jgi:hypothetical protein